jgi:hypothetical protein
MIMTLEEQIRKMVDDSAVLWHRNHDMLSSLSILPSGNFAAGAASPGVAASPRINIIRI